MSATMCGYWICIIIYHSQSSDNFFLNLNICHLPYHLKSHKVTDFKHVLQYLIGYINEQPVSNIINRSLWDVVLKASENCLLSSQAFPATLQYSITEPKQTCLSSYVLYCHLFVPVNIHCAVYSQIRHIAYITNQKSGNSFALQHHAVKPNSLRGFRNKVPSIIDIITRDGQ